MVKREDTENMDSKEWEVSSAKLMKAHGFATGPEDAKKAARDMEAAERLSADILRLAQNTLLINLRFLESAFVHIVPGYDTDTLEIATDGRFLYYNAVHVCRLFKKAKELPSRDYLHVVLHCIFRHLFVGKNVIPEIWNLACDIAVENIINSLGIKSLYCERQAYQEWLINELKDEIPKLSAEWIYKYFDENDTSLEDIEHLQKNFHADDHSIWYNKVEVEKGDGEKDENDAGTPEGDLGDADDDEGVEEDMSPEEEGEDAGSNEEMIAAVESEDGGGAGGSGDGEADTGQPALTPAELEKQWEEIAERIEVDLDTFSESYGEGAGDMQQALREVNREKYDYAELLRRFAVFGENVEINDDEFDYIFYTYGMDLYGDIPLVEPLEYKEVKRVREFVIALDTSESVAGELVQKFVTKTWNILKQSENFFTRVNVHIIQCGARVEEDVRITTEEEFDAYMEDMVLKGFGGTDFRPVFERVDSLIRQQEFHDLKGLIYFTDGYGAFPEVPPDYEACFVFLDQGYDLPEVPVWAVNIVLREEDIQRF